MDALIPLLADTLGAGSMDAEPLARMLHDKTGGDPLRVNQFLAAVHREGFIDFDDDKNDYLVGLIVNRIREMPEATQAALRTAACLGNRFDVRVVADVGNISVAQANEALRPACVDGLLVIEERARETHLWFHDRFQQAALSAISDAQLPQVRLDIGRAMLRESTPEELRARAFEIAGHLNDGISLLKDPRERLELARLNLMTGRRATEANAHAAGLGFLRTGIDLLPADAWDVELELALALYRARAECELYVGHNEEAERLLRIALDHAPGMLEKIDIYEALMIAHMNMLRFADAIAVGLDALQLLGISLPRDADGWRGSAASGMSLLRQRLAGIDVAELLDRPLADSPIHKAASRILDRMVPPAHNTSADLFVLITVELLKISLEHGHVGASPYGYECYGMLLPGAGGDQSTALEFGRLGVALVDKMGLIEGRSAVLFVFAYFICPWKRKLTESFASFRDGYRAGIEGRDPPHVAYNLMGLCQYTYFSGQPLECVDPELEKLEQYSREIRIEMAFGAGEALRQTLRALRGLTSHPTSLSDNAFDEKVFFRTMVEGKVYLTSNFYYLVKLQLCVLAGDLAGATASAKEFEAVKFVSSTTFMAVEYCFYHSLLLAAACASLSQEDRAGHLGKLRANLQQLEGWANDSPDNVRHKKLLIEAELARLENQDGDAVRGYEESIRTARKCGALRDEAIAHEAAGGFYLSRGRTAVGHAFITDARAVYMQWGAEAKVRQLDEKYCNRREGVSAAALGVGAAQLDAMAVIKGSQAISTELVLNKLVDSLMRVVIEHAGAETGYLLLFRDRQLWIEAAAGTALHGPNAIPPRVLALEAANLPQMIIDFVRQTGESVLLADATKENPFRGDPYIVEHEPRSVLCLPMKRQGQLIGMVYLENNLMTDAFSRDRVAILEVLSAQAAISIDNATLYEELEQRVEERTRELEASMRQLKENHAHLVVAERKAAVAPFEREMAIAQQIQISILPRNLSLEGLEVSAGMCTASEVGGDYYDVCATEDRGGWIGIGDVSGHGLYAGLIMLMIQSGLASLMRFAPFAEPHALLTLLNTMLYENVHERLASTDFATLSLFRYHRDGRLRVAGAHEDTLIWRAASGKCERIPTSGTWVAAMADVARHMTSKTHQLHAGDVVLLYTDGITEAMSPTREQFGVQRLSDALARFHELPVDEIRDRVFSTVNAWSSVLADDRTLVVLRYRGPSAVTVESGVS
jgi:serine phosphatase RsbU (regulator of sigma subunit)